MTAAANRGVVFTAQTLLARLHRHYTPPGPLPGGLFAAEVAVNGGRVLSRCDAVYVGFTSASGRRMIGHEIKVTRADWRRELDQAGKADYWHDACQEWWVVAPSTEVVPPEELPAGWGLMVVNPRTATRLDKVRRAEVRPHDPPWEAVRSFMARVDTIRAQAESAHRNQVENTIRAQLTATQDRHQAAAAELRLTPEVRTATKVVALIQAARNTTQTWMQVPPETIAAAALDHAALTDRAQVMRAQLARLETILAGSAADAARILAAVAELDRQAAENNSAQPLTRTPPAPIG